VPAEAKIDSDEDSPRRFDVEGYFGDNVPLDTLSKMAGLQLDFGIECFSVPQS
jgi:hypothetical protein